MKRVKIYLLALSLTVTILLNALNIKLVGASFQQNRLIDDTIFNNSGTMSQASIDAWLNSFPNSCISTNHGFSAPDVTGYSPSGPISTGGFSYGPDVSAGTIIYHASQVYGINPQVILTTLEKEEGLVDGSGYPGNPACSNLRYTAAMGYLCTDTVTPHDYSGFELYSLNGTPVTSVNGTCTQSSHVAGFSRQVLVATWQLKFDQQRSEGNMSFNVQLRDFPYAGDVWDNSDDPGTCYTHKMTQGYYRTCPSGAFATYDGLYSIDGTTVHMENGSTAALYNYTPHFPGNQNFDTIFQNWFGSLYYSYGNIPSYKSVYANATCNVAAFDPSYVARLYQPDNGDYLYTSSTSEACSAIKLGYIWDGIVMKSPSGTSTVPVYRLANLIRHYYTTDSAEVTDYTNNRGYHNEGVAFYAYPTQQTNSLPVYRLNNGSTSLFTSAGAEGQYFVNTLGYQSPGITFYTPALNTGMSVARLAKLDERLYTIDSSEVNYALQHGYSSEGIVSSDDVMPTSNNLPVYRLVGPAGHFYTESRVERDLAVINFGYYSEGIAFYAPAGSYPNVHSVYREKNYQDLRTLFTSNFTERNDARTYYGYVDEGIGWYGY